MQSLQRSLLGNREPEDPSNSGSTVNDGSRINGMTFVDWLEKEVPVFTEKMRYLCYSPEYTEDGRFHWQGYVYWKNGRTIKAAYDESNKKRLREDPDTKLVRWYRVADGSAKQNRIYCGAGDWTDGTRSKVKNPKFVEFGQLPEQGRRKKIQEAKEDPNLIAYEQMMIEDYTDVVWKPWQLDLLNKAIGKPDRREITWIWEGRGLVGKSFIGDYLVWKHNFMIVDGARKDMFSAVADWFEACVPLRGIILDLSRAEEECVSYAALEKFKGRHIFSGKFKSGMLKVPPLHVMVFSNFPPKYGKQSADRWNIIDLNTPIEYVEEKYVPE